MDLRRAVVCLLGLLLQLPAAALAQALVVSDAGQGADRRVSVDGPHYTLTVNPSYGGRIERFVHKPSGVELTRPPVKDHHGGLLADGVWQQDFWHSDWNDQPYQLTIDATPQRVELTLRRTALRWTGVSIAKSIVCTAASPDVVVNYLVRGDAKVNERAKPDLHLVQAMAKRGRVFAVSPTGVQTMPHWSQDESWVFEPTRNWLAWLPEGGGPGLAVLVDFEQLRLIRTTHDEVDTLEFILRKTQVTPKSRLAFTLSLRPIESVEPLIDAAAKQAVVAPMGPQRVEVGDTPTWARFNPKDFDFSSQAVRTPHRTWARPYAGGRPRVLAILPGHQQRQAVELAQRFDMDLTCPFIGTFAHGQVSTYYILGDRVRNLKINELHEQLDAALARDYDVILTSYYDGWSALPEAARKKLIEKCQAGTGLLLAARGDAPDEIKPFLPFDFKGYDHARGRLLADDNDLPLAKALPFSVMPIQTSGNGAAMKPGMEKARLVRNDGHGPYPFVTVSDIGKGRLVVNTLGLPLLPPVQTQLETPAFDYHEYQMALLARLMYWAARKESPVNLTAITPSDKAIVINLTAADAAATQIELTLRDAFGEVISQQTVTQALTAGGNQVTITPERAGIERCLLADVIVRDERGTLAWGSGVMPESSTTTIAALKLSKESYEPGEPLHVDVSFKGLVPLESSLRLSLYDGSGRLVERKEVDGFDPIAADLPLARVIGPWFQLRGEYLMNGVVVHQAAVEGHIALRPEPRRISTSFWGWGPQGPEALVEAGFDQFRRMGMNANFSARDTWMWRSLDRLNMPFTVQGIGLYANSGTTLEQRLNPKDPAAKQVVYAPANPDAVAKNHEVMAERGKTYRTFNSILYSLGDENRGEIADTCFSDVALKSLREWLQATQYASLDALNGEWKTAFKSWDEVMPMTEAQIKQHGEKTGSFAAWADQRMFNKWAYAQYGAAAVDGALSTDPQALVGPSGDQNSSAYGGRDWWHHARAFNAMAGYSGSQVIEQLSFNPQLIYRPWAGYSKPNPLIRAQLLNLLGINSHGFHVFSATTHIDPDYTLPECGRDLRAAMLQVMRGPGQLLVDATMANAGVYILQSPQSIHAAYITGRAADQAGSRDGAEDLLNNLAIGYRAVSYEQLERGHLRQVEARALVLPYAIAMSDAQCAAVADFINSGGLVIADVEPATFTDHCRRRDSNPLSGLLNHERFVLLGEPMFKEFLDLREKLLDAQPRQRFQTILQRVGEALARVNVAPAFVVRNREGGFGEAGTQAPWIWTAVKDRGPIRYALVVRNYTSIQFDTPDQPATVTFDRDRHLYDVLEGRYLGQGRTLDLTLVNNTARVLALLPYRVSALSLDGPAEAGTGQSVTLQAALKADAACGDHLLRLEVLDPTGRVRREYAADVRAPGGAAEFSVPFAFNDPAGDWRVVVTDVATGTRAQATLTLR